MTKVKDARFQMLKLLEYKGKSSKELIKYMNCAHWTVYKELNRTRKYGLIQKIEHKTPIYNITDKGLAYLNNLRILNND